MEMGDYAIRKTRTRRGIKTFNQQQVRGGKISNQARKRRGGRELSLFATCVKSTLVNFKEQERT